MGEKVSNGKLHLTILVIFGTTTLGKSANDTVTLFLWIGGEKRLPIIDLAS